MYRTSSACRRTKANVSSSRRSMFTPAPPGTQDGRDADRAVRRPFNAHAANRLKRSFPHRGGERHPCPVDDRSEVDLDRSSRLSICSSNFGLYACRPLLEFLDLVFDGSEPAVLAFTQVIHKLPQ